MSTNSLSKIPITPDFLDNSMNDDKQISSFVTELSKISNDFLPDIDSKLIATNLELSDEEKETAKLFYDMCIEKIKEKVFPCNIRAEVKLNNQRKVMTKLAVMAVVYKIREAKYHVYITQEMSILARSFVFVVNFDIQ